MFDPVTDEALRIRRRGPPAVVRTVDPTSRTSLICSVCSREIRPEEEVFWVGEEVHCFQCHSMLEYELEEERKIDTEAREKGTRWDSEGGE